MVRMLSAGIVVGCVLLTCACAAEPSDAELRKKPITTDAGEVGKLLQKWWKEGTAAGNVGDWYDNRDGEHSPLDLRPWPQLRKVQYSPADIKARRHWALQPRTLPHVVFGNSSTSAPPTLSGSNPRTYYCSAMGLGILQRHYLEHNLYIYPEHRDHDPGHNGVGDGFGDLYPTNTPYLLISQGSSGSDQPFMRALPFTLAAFRPEVKKKLIESGLLMPTVQMVFRSSNRHLKGPGEYLSGKAHPTVFEGSWVDPLKMVRLAHDIRLDNIPPLVKLRVVEEDEAVPGRDFFDRPALSEKHSDTVSVIARIWRGAGYRRRLVVSAEKSLDVNRKPLTFTWVVLRGDDKRIHIKPRNKSGSVAEISVAYHQRRPVAPGSALESNRVDIGVFAHNGVHYSAPGFVTFFSLDSEGRTYDDRGRIVEIGYGMGETELTIPDPAKLFAELSRDALPARLLGLTEAVRTELGQVVKEAGPLQADVERARQERRKAEAEGQKAAAELAQARNDLERARRLAAQKRIKEQELKEAQARFKTAEAAQQKAQAVLRTASEVVAKAEKAREALFDRRRDVLKAAPRALLLGRLRRAAATVTLWNDHAGALLKLATGPAAAQRQARLDAARAKLLQLGIIVNGPGKSMVFRPARTGTAPAVQRLSAYEKAMLEEFNAVVLSELLLPGLVGHSFRGNFVDARLTAPRAWRDVYHHDGDRLLGWTRYHPGPGSKPEEFTAEGWLVVEKDANGRPAKARTVGYRQGRQARPMWINTNPLLQVKGEELITFEYVEGQRKVKSREKVLEAKE